MPVNVKSTSWLRLILKFFKIVVNNHISIPSVINITMVIIFKVHIDIFQHKYKQYEKLGNHFKSCCFTLNPTSNSILRLYCIIYCTIDEYLP